MKTVKTDGVHRKGAHLGNASVLSFDQAQTSSPIRGENITTEEAAVLLGLSIWTARKVIAQREEGI